MHVRVRLALAALAAAAAVPITASAPAGATTTIPITDCGVEVPTGTVGVVQNDIECSEGFGEVPAFGIQLERGGKLDLNGHTIHYVEPTDAYGIIRCVARCEIHGPGSLTADGTGVAIQSGWRSPLFARDLTIMGPFIAIDTDESRVKLENASISATTVGVSEARSVRLENVDVTLTDVPFTGDCIGTSTGSGSVRGQTVTLSGCGTGIDASRSVNVTNLTVTNSRHGVSSGSGIRLIDSSVTGSTDVDLSSRRRPSLTNVTCDTSERWFLDGTPATTWGVCAND